MRSPSPVSSKADILRLQMAAIPLLDPDRVLQDKVSALQMCSTRVLKFQISLQKCFRAKRDHVLARLEKMGLPVKVPPMATFYIWLDLEHLGAPLNNGLTFFEELLKVCLPDP